MDASEIYSKRLNAKEVTFPKQGEFMFPIADGRIKTPGGNQELRTSTLVRHRPVQGESPHWLSWRIRRVSCTTSRLTSGCRWSNERFLSPISGSFIYRHHVEPRVKIYSPKEESFPIPLKYVDVTGTTHANLDVKQEKRIDDYWNIDGSRDLSDPWTGFTQFTLLEEKAPDGYMWSGERLTKKQVTSRSDHLWPELWKSMGKHAKMKEKQKWSEEKAPSWKRKKNCVGSISSDPEDTEFKETIKNARKKLETSVAPAMPCKIMKNCGSGGSNRFKTKLACILEADEFTRKRMGNSILHHHEGPYCIINGHMSPEKCWIGGKAPKNKGRVVPRGDIVKDDSGSYAVFTKQGSSAFSNDSIGNHGYHLQIARFRWTSSKSSISLYSSKNGKYSQILENSQIGVSRHLESSTATKMAKIMVQYGRPSCSSWAESVRSSFGRTIVGKAIWENPMETWLGENLQIGNVSLFIVKNIIIFVCGWHQNWLERNKILIRCGKYLTKKSIWENQHLSWIMFTWAALKDSMQIAKILWTITEPCSNREFPREGRGVQKLPFPQNIRISSWAYDMAGHAQKCMERYCELANKTTQQLYKVSTPCIDDHHSKEEEMKGVG